MVDKSGPVPQHRPDLGQCWIWLGSKSSEGYGYCRNGEGKLVSAHRFGYELEYGPIPQNFAEEFLGSKTELLHFCDNPSCVRPTHLSVGTAQENTQDKLNKHREAKVTGERNGRVTLSDAQIVAIRERYAQGKPTRQLAETFTTSRRHIYSVVQGRVRASAGGPVSSPRTKRITEAA
jgi:hypothetical protein